MITIHTTHYNIIDLLRHLDIDAWDDCVRIFKEYNINDSVKYTLFDVNAFTQHLSYQKQGTIPAVGCSVYADAIIWNHVENYIQ